MSETSIYDSATDTYDFTGRAPNGFINVGLQITRRCNIRCTHCCESAQMEDPSHSKLMSLIDALAEGNITKINVTGGEPLLSTALLPALDRIRSHRIPCSLSSNAILLDESKFQDVLPLIDCLRLSIHGDETTHNRISKSAIAYAANLNALQLARLHGIPVSVVASIMKDNFKQIDEIASVCSEFGVEKLHLFSLIQRGRAVHSFFDRCMGFDAITEAGHAASLRYNISVNCVDWRKEGQCTLVFPNGDLVSTPMFGEQSNILVLGNLHENTLSELWSKFPRKQEYIDYYRKH